MYFTHKYILYFNKKINKFTCKNNNIYIILIIAFFNFNVKKSVFNIIL